MKISRLVPILFSAAAVVLSSSAFAGEANKTSLHLSDKVMVQGQSLNSGDYTVRWNGNGPDVQVTILHGKQSVATLSGRLTDQAAPDYSETAYGTHEGQDGSRSLTVIYPAHKKLALEFDQSAQASQGN